MSDIRKNRGDQFKDQLAERGNPHGGRGRRAERNIEEQFTSHTGRPMGEQRPARGARQPNGAAPPKTLLTRDQHARKGQAQSPRELNPNQPEKKRNGHRHG